MYVCIYIFRCVVRFLGWLTFISIPQIGISILMEIFHSKSLHFVNIK